MQVAVFTREVKPNPVRIPAYFVDSCMLVNPSSHLQYKRKNNQDTHAPYENLSASIGPDIRHLHLVYINTELSDHPEHEVLIISFSPPLSAAYVVHQLVLLNLCLCRRCSYGVSCICLHHRSEPGFIVTFKKMCKISFANWRYWKFGNVSG